MFNKIEGGGLHNIPPMGGSPPEAADELNKIISHINRYANNDSGALYLGHAQRYAIRTIAKNDILEPKGDDDFAEWNVIWVMKDSYIRLI